MVSNREIYILKVKSQVFSQKPVLCRKALINSQILYKRLNDRFRNIQFAHSDFAIYASLWFQDFFFFFFVVYAYIL